MRAAYDKGISLLDNCVCKTAQPLLNSTNHIHLNPKQRTDLRLLDLANTHDLRLLHKIGNGQPHHTPAMFKLHYVEQMQIINLQQSLMELQDQLAQAREAQNEKKREKNDGLNKTINRAERTVEAIYGEID